MEIRVVENCAVGATSGVEATAPSQVSPPAQAMNRHTHRELCVHAGACSLGGDRNEGAAVWPARLRTACWTWVQLAAAVSILWPSSAARASAVPTAVCGQGSHGRRNGLHD